MLIDPRAIIFFAGNTLLLYLTMLVNSTIGEWSLHLVLIGPMFVLPTLFLDHRSFVICTLVTGLWIDTSLPVPFGMFTVSMLIIGTLIFTFRIRFRSEHNYHPVVIAHLINATCILIMAFSMNPAQMSLLGYWLHVSTTAALSHISLVLVAPWFFDLMRLLLHLLRQDLTPKNMPRA